MSLSFVCSVGVKLKINVPNTFFQALITSCKWNQPRSITLTFHEFKLYTYIWTPHMRMLQERAWRMNHSPQLRKMACRSIIMSPPCADFECPRAQACLQSYRLRALVSLASHFQRLIFLHFQVESSCCHSYYNPQPACCYATVHSVHSGC